MPFQVSTKADKSKFNYLRKRSPKVNKTTSVSLLDAEPQQKLESKPTLVTRNRLNRPLVSHLKSKNLKEPYQLSETFQSSFYVDSFY